MRAQSDLVEVVAELKQVICVKGYVQRPNRTGGVMIKLSITPLLTRGLLHSCGTSNRQQST